MEKKLTVTVELNKKAILHLLRYIRGIYVTSHDESGQHFETQECIYCLTVLTQLKTNLEELQIQEKIRDLRVLAKRRRDIEKKNALV